MCRLAAITATNIPLSTKVALLDRLMLMGNADRQTDGWGVADESGNGAKSGGDYFRGVPTWMRRFRNEIFIGHVRSASFGTEMGTDAAHPYVFKDDTGAVDFIGAHNGQFLGTWKNQPTGLPNAVNTDSWRAFFQLHKKIAGRIIEPDIVTDWLSVYDDTSAFALLILQNNILSVVRNSQRTLHMARIGNGFVIHTAKEALESLAEYATSFRLVIDNIEAVPEQTLVQIGRGQPDLLCVEKLDLKLTPARAVSNYGNYRSDGGAVLVTTNNRGDDAELRALWDKFVAKCEPMRVPLCEYYAAFLLGKKSAADEYDLNWQELTPATLNELIQKATEAALNEEQKALIGVWNRLQAPVYEYDSAVYYFDKPFWLVPNSRATLEEIGRRGT